MDRPEIARARLRPWSDAPAPPAEPREVFEKDMWLAARIALVVAVGGAAAWGTVAYLLPALHLPPWPCLVMAAPAFGAILWCVFMCIAGFIMTVADVDLTKEQNHKLSLFPAWQMPSSWGGDMARPAARARRVGAFMLWWSICFGVAMLFPYLL